MKKALLTVLLIILVILNVFGFLILGAMYFFGFDLQWGFTLPAVTWGLPVFAGALAVLAIILLLIKRNKYLLGILGIGIVIGLNVYLGLLSFYFPSLLLPEPENVPAQYVDSMENRIIILVLKDQLTSGCTIVDPKSCSSIDLSTNERIDGWKHSINSQMKTADYDFSALVETFAKVNKDPVSLDLKSDPQNGYFVDYDQIFDRYFEKGGGGWIRLRISHPFIAGSTRISIPAYDPDTGYILVEVGTTSDYLAGMGGIYAYKYENGKLIYIGYVMTWIS